MNLVARTVPPPVKSGVRACSPPAPDQPDGPRRLLRGKWRLDTVLGKGGAATVYAATHRNGLRGAVKVLHPHLAGEPRIVRRFAMEGWVANRIAHPGVVRALDDDKTDDGVMFLVMELLEGQTVKAMWQRAGKRLPLEDALVLGEEILEVLEAVHAHGVVHRDIKPDNVFLTARGPKLLDFGIARLIGAGGEAGDDGLAVGTPAYMPPEQARGRAHETDHRADLYALASMIWHLVAGRPVHGVTTQEELMIAAATKRAPPIASAIPNVHPAVADVLDRALAFDRDRRWPNAGAMLAALREARGACFEPTLSIPLPAIPEMPPVPVLPAIAEAAASDAPPMKPSPRRWVLGAALGAFGLAGLLIGVGPGARPASTSVMFPTSLSEDPVIPATALGGLEPALQEPAARAAATTVPSGAASSEPRPRRSGERRRAAAPPTGSARPVETAIAPAPCREDVDYDCPTGR